MKTLNVALMATCLLNLGCVDIDKAKEDLIQAMDVKFTHCEEKLDEVLTQLAYCQIGEEE